MKSFLAGLGTGVAIGVLIAPRSGNETRSQLRTKANDIGDRAAQQAERARRVAADLQEQAGSLGQKAVEQARNATSQIREAAQRLAVRAGVGPLAMLNTASREELMEVRGIGPVLADRIIEGRPFTSADQVVERGILPANLLEELTRSLKSA